MPKKHLHFTNQCLAENSQKLCVSKTCQVLKIQHAENEANKIMHIALPIGKECFNGKRHRRTSQSGKIL